MSKYPNKLVNELGKRLLEIEQEYGVETCLTVLAHTAGCVLSTMDHFHESLNARDLLGEHADECERWYELSNYAIESLEDLPAFACDTDEDEVDASKVLWGWSTDIAEA